MTDKPVYPPFEQTWAEKATFHIHLNKVDVWTVQWSPRRPDKGKIVLLKFGHEPHLYRVVPYIEMDKYSETFPEYYDPIRAYLDMMGVFRET